MIDVHDEYYNSDAYREALDRAAVEASHDVNKAGKFPNRPASEFDKRYVAALLERGLVIKQLNMNWVEGKPYPCMAPKPFSNGFPYPSYIVKVSKKEPS